MVGEIRSSDLGRGGGVGQTEVAQAEVFAPGGVFVETLGIALEGVLAQEGETRIGGPLHESIEIAVAVDDVFAQHLQSFRLDAVVSGRHNVLRFPVEGTEIGAVVFGTELKIVAGIARFFASAANEGAHVGFVGRFVVRKTRVAVDAIGHVAGGEPGEGGIDGGHARGQLFDPSGKLRLHGLALFLVCGKPLAVVVGSQAAQKIDDVLHEQMRN